MKIQTVEEKETGIVFRVDGLFMHGNQYGIDAMRSFLDGYKVQGIEGQFDSLSGSYLARIDDPIKGTLLFSDNSGMRRWYYNVDAVRFCSTLKEAMSEKVKMNPNAVAQFLYFGCVYSLDTIIDNVKISDPEKYYIVKESSIAEFSKDLASFEERIDEAENAFKDVMIQYGKALGDWKNHYATITGGVDSRAVLSHLIYNGERPILDITGAPGHIDVEIAKQIADRTNLSLDFIDDGIDETDWIQEAIEAAKLGGTPVLGTWRLYKKARFLANVGDVIECGGLAGELYKNSFINQEFPFYFGKEKWKKFLKYKVIIYGFPVNICGEEIAPYISGMDQYMLEWVDQYSRNNKSKSYLEAGYRILQQRSCGVATMNGFYYDQYSPLIERRVAYSVYNKTPYGLEMQSWQRRQTTEYCPDIMDIKTDRGLTANSKRMVSEWLKSMLFLTGVFLERLIPRKKDLARIDTCFEEGLKTDAFLTAFSRCKELGIIDSSVDVDKLPLDISDRVFLLGILL